MKKIKFLRLLSGVLAISLMQMFFAGTSTVVAYTGPFSYSHVFENIPPRVSMNWGSPTGTFRGITCKWNQPRDVGTNPHQGIDMDTPEGPHFLDLRAVWCGWLQPPLGTDSMGINMTKRLDLNQNGLKDDPAMFVNYYHARSKMPTGYYPKGAVIGSTGSSHIHWGGTTAGAYTANGARWFRNEVHYRWLSADVWREGRDVDTFSRVAWNNNVAMINVYFRTTALTSPPPAEVRIFHRRSGITPPPPWVDGGTMTAEPGDVFAYNFTGRYPSSTVIDWLVRIRRGGLPTNVYPWAWAPARFNQPNSNPNAAGTQPRPFYTNTVN